MTNIDVARALQSDLENPGAIKSGEYLQERILRTVRRALVAGERDGVVEALREWLILRREPHTMLAVTAAKKEHLTELVLEIVALRADVLGCRVFPKFYLRWIDDALSSFRGSTP
jgi:hypothetical protein